MLACCAALQPCAFAQSPSGDATRPRIGLVLSGGGARGAAHVGVLKVLEQQRVPIDAIAGTSMGAVVGGLYASGLSAAEIERVMRAVDWQRTFVDRPPREDLAFRRKEEDRDFLVQAPLGLRGRRFLIPKGIVQGQRLNATLRRLTVPVALATDFDALPTPFRAIATDLETGEGVVLGQGDLALAMRASLSAPGFLAPVERDGQLLVDGGLSENLPVDIVRAMGVDIVIAVDAGFPLLGRRQLDSVPVISNQMLAILIRKGSARQRALLTPRDIVIDPPLGDVSSFDFTEVPRLIDVGEAAARELLPRLAPLGVPPEQYATYVARRDAARGARVPRIDFVRTEGEPQRYGKAVDALFEPLIGKPFALPSVERRIGQLYGQGNLELLDYRVVEDGASEGLVVTARRNSWGPNYVRFGLNLSDDFEGNAAYNAAARFVLAELTSLGAEWGLDLQIGESPRIATELYLPLSYRRRWFLLPQVGFEARNVPVFDAGSRVAEYRVSDFRYGLDFGREFDTTTELRVGIRHLDGESRVRLGDPLLPEERANSLEYYARFAYDTLDDVNFPRRGSSFFLDWRADQPRDSDSSDAELATLDWLSAYSWGRNTVALGASAGTDFSGDPSSVRNLYTLGGFLNLSGLARGEIAGRHFAVTRALYYRQLGRGGNGILQLPVYAGLSVELGNVWDERSDISFGSARRDFALYLGLDSFLGPVYLGAGWDDSGETAYYLSLGRSF